MLLPLPLTAPPQPLLARVAAGDATALRRCIAEYGPLVWSIARRMSPSEAEAVVQEVFAELWQSAERYDPRVASEPAFLTMIARRRLIESLRRTGRRPQLEPRVDSLIAEQPAAVEHSPEAAIAASTLAALDPRQRRVLSLAIGHGLDHAQLAELTELPIGTIKSLVRRALVAVRRRLRPDEHGFPGDAGESQKRLHTLLTDRAIEGLDDEAERELEWLLAGATIDPSYEQAGAAIELALLPHDQALPERLVATLVGQAEHVLGRGSAPEPPSRGSAPEPPSRGSAPEPGAAAHDTQSGYAPADVRHEVASGRDPRRWTGSQPAVSAARKRAPEPLAEPVHDDESDESGESDARESSRGASSHTAVIDLRERRSARIARIAAYLSAVAALVVLAIAVYLLWSGRRSAELDPAELRAQVEGAADHVKWELAPSFEDELVSDAAGGTVVWSSELQAGVLVLQGLSANEPTESQYQLWILDATRAGPPVDGGVFDVELGGDELVIPIDAKLLVGEPKAFTITVERPGGVVVSAQERVVMVAAPPSP